MFPWLWQNLPWVCVVWLLGGTLVALFCAGARRARPHVEPKQRRVMSWSEVQRERQRLRSLVEGSKNGMGC